MDQHEINTCLPCKIEMSFEAMQLKYLIKTEARNRNYILTMTHQCNNIQTLLRKMFRLQHESRNIYSQ